MARMFGDEVVVSLDAVHVDDRTHEVVVEGEEKGGVEGEGGKGVTVHKEEITV
jgi:hypothetical protein